MKYKLSPLAPEKFPDMPGVSGVRLLTGRFDPDRSRRDNLLVIILDSGTTVAGTLTRSFTRSAPVEWCAQALPNGLARAVIINSRNANVFSEQADQSIVTNTVKCAARLLDCSEQEILVASTGVIGEPLPLNVIADALPSVFQENVEASWQNAARAIMTTDTFPKGSMAQTTIEETSITIAGIAKGSGMIAPNMATMLAFIFTDARLPASVLQILITQALESTFHCITVDGDTSTSDTILLLATGHADHRPIIEVKDSALENFRSALQAVMQDLALQIVRDGEGAQKLITITISKAKTNEIARHLGLSIANSPLVKTAIAGADLNWGRIIMALGKTEYAVERDRIVLAIGGITVLDHGRAITSYDHHVLDAHLQGREVAIDIDLGLGSGKATVWTCDLTHGYIDINASYRS